MSGLILHMTEEGIRSIEMNGRNNTEHAGKFNRAPSISLLFFFFPFNKNIHHKCVLQPKLSKSSPVAHWKLV